MNETARMQTTKGIWISQGKDMKALIMDVEGTDGRERGEDQVYLAFCDSDPCFGYLYQT